MDTPFETPAGTPAVETRVVETPVGKRFRTKDIVEVALQLLALGLLLFFCYSILSPFIDPVVWGAVLAVSLYPIHQRMKTAFKGKGTLAAILLAFIMVCLLVVPAVWLTLTTTGQVKDVVVAYRAGQITVPPPTEKVKDWPLIGNKAYAVWSRASSNLDSLIQENPDQVKSIAGKGAGLLASTGKAILFIAFAIIISGVFLSYATESADFAKRLFQRLLRSKTFDMSALAASTIRNVVKGILGVAIIQSTLALAGFLVGGIPYAGIWFFLCLVLAIIQVGILPVSIGVIIYAWSALDSLTATLLTIWLAAVGLLDNVLKPIMMGKGASVPMLVIFLGALGGFIFSGIIGLFTGAIVLSLGYRLFDAWLKETDL
ncbi:MAG TPA: AI-2E family transporter [Chitinophagaceae bacterium]